MKPSRFLFVRILSALLITILSAGPVCADMLRVIQPEYREQRFGLEEALTSGLEEQEPLAEFLLGGQDPFGFKLFRKGEDYLLESGTPIFLVNGTPSSRVPLRFDESRYITLGSDPGNGIQTIADRLERISPFHMAFVRDDDRSIQVITFGADRPTQVDGDSLVASPHFLTISGRDYFVFRLGQRHFLARANPSRDARHRDSWYLPEDSLRLPFGEAGVVSLGQLKTNDVVISHRHVSKKHAELQLRDETVWIRDLDSTNHTFVHGEQIGAEPARIHDVTTGEILRETRIGQRLSQSLFGLAGLNYHLSQSGPDYFLTGPHLHQALTVREIPFDENGRADLGRAGGNTIVLNDPSTSSYHAWLSRNDDGSVSIQDLGSLNGTYVDGERIGEDAQQTSLFNPMWQSTIQRVIYTPAQASDDPTSGQEEAGMEEVAGLEEWQEIAQIEFAGYPMQLRHREDKFQLRAETAIFMLDDTSRQRVSLSNAFKYSPYVTLGTHPGSLIRIDSPHDANLIMAFLLDYDGSIQVIGFPGRGPIWVNGQGPPATPEIFTVGDSDYFVFPRGNRYFLAGPRIHDPNRPDVSPLITEIPFSMDGRATFGRHTDNAIMIANSEASRDHALLQQDENGRVFIKDLDTTNGTWIRDQNIKGKGPVLLYDPLALPIQTEVYSPYPDFEAIKQSARRIIFMDPAHQAEQIREQVAFLNQSLGAIDDPTMPPMLYHYLASIGTMDVEHLYSSALEHYLGPFLERFVFRLHNFGPAEEVSTPLTTLLFYFLLGGFEGHPRVWFEAAQALERLRLPEFPEDLAGIFLAHQAARPQARGFYDRSLIKAIGRMDSVQGLVEFLRQSGIRDDLRVQAIQILGEHGAQLQEEDVLGVLSALSFDVSKPVVLAAMEALGNAGNPRAGLGVFSVYTGRHSETGAVGTSDPEIQAVAQRLLAQVRRRMLEQQEAADHDTQEIDLSEIGPLPDDPSDAEDGDRAGQEEGKDDAATPGPHFKVPVATKVAMGEWADDLNQHLTAYGEITQPTRAYGEARFALKVVERTPLHNTIGILGTYEWIDQHEELNDHLYSNALWDYAPVEGRPWAQIFVNRHAFPDDTETLLAPRVQIFNRLPGMTVTEESAILAQALRVVGEWGQSRSIPFHLIQPKVLEVARPGLQPAIVMRNYHRLGDRTNWQISRPFVVAKSMLVPERPFRWYRYVGPSAGQEEHRFDVRSREFKMLTAGYLFLVGAPSAIALTADLMMRPDSITHPNKKEVLPHIFQQLGIPEGDLQALEEAVNANARPILSQGKLKPVMALVRDWKRDANYDQAGKAITRALLGDDSFWVEQHAPILLQAEDLEHMRSLAALIQTETSGFNPLDRREADTLLSSWVNGGLWLESEEITIARVDPEDYAGRTEWGAVDVVLSTEAVVDTRVNAALGMMPIEADADDQAPLIHPLRVQFDNLRNHTPAFPGSHSGLVLSSDFEPGRITLTVEAKSQMELLHQIPALLVLTAYLAPEAIDSLSAGQEESPTETLLAQLEAQFPGNGEVETVVRVIGEELEGLHQPHQRALLEDWPTLVEARDALRAALETGEPNVFPRQAAAALRREVRDLVLVVQVAHTVPDTPILLFADSAQPEITPPSAHLLDAVMTRLREVDAQAYRDVIERIRLISFNVIPDNDASVFWPDLRGAIDLPWPYLMSYTHEQRLARLMGSLVRGAHSFAFQEEWPEDRVIIPLEPGGATEPDGHYGALEAVEGELGLADFWVRLARHYSRALPSEQRSADPRISTLLGWLSRLFDEIDYRLERAEFWRGLPEGSAALTDEGAALIDDQVRRYHAVLRARDAFVYDIQGREVRDRPRGVHLPDDRWLDGTLGTAKQAVSSRYGASAWVGSTYPVAPMVLELASVAERHASQSSIRLLTETLPTLSELLTPQAFRMTLNLGLRTADRGGDVDRFFTRFILPAVRRLQQARYPDAEFPTMHDDLEQLLLHSEDPALHLTNVLEYGPQLLESTENDQQLFSALDFLLALQEAAGGMDWIAFSDQIQVRASEWVERDLNAATHALEVERDRIQIAERSDGGGLEESPTEAALVQLEEWFGDDGLVRGAIGSIREKLNSLSTYRRQLLEDWPDVVEARQMLLTALQDQPELRPATEVRLLRRRVRETDRLLRHAPVIPGTEIVIVHAHGSKLGDPMGTNALLQDALSQIRMADWRMHEEVLRRIRLVSFGAIAGNTGSSRWTSLQGALDFPWSYFLGLRKEERVIRMAHSLIWAAYTLQFQEQWPQEVLLVESDAPQVPAAALYEMLSTIDADLAVTDFSLRMARGYPQRVYQKQSPASTLVPRVLSTLLAFSRPKEADQRVLTLFDQFMSRASERLSGIGDGFAVLEQWGRGVSAGQLTTQGKAFVEEQRRRYHKTVQDRDAAVFVRLGKPPGWWDRKPWPGRRHVQAIGEALKSTQTTLADRHGGSAWEGTGYPLRQPVGQLIRRSEQLHQDTALMLEEQIPALIRRLTRSQLQDALSLAARVADRSGDINRFFSGLLRPMLIALAPDTATPISPEQFHLAYSTLESLLLRPEDGAVHLTHVLEYGPRVLERVENDQQLFSALVFLLALQKEAGGMDWIAFSDQIQVRASEWVERDLSTATHALEVKGSRIQIVKRADGGGLEEVDTAEAKEEWSQAVEILSEGYGVSEGELRETLHSSDFWALRSAGDSLEAIVRFYARVLLDAGVLQGIPSDHGVEALVSALHSEQGDARDIAQQIPRSLVQRFSGLDGATTYTDFIARLGVFEDGVRDFLANLPSDEASVLLWDFLRRWVGPAEFAQEDQAAMRRGMHTVLSAFDFSHPPSDIEPQVAALMEWLSPTSLRAIAATINAIFPFDRQKAVFLRHFRLRCYHALEHHSTYSHPEVGGAPAIIWIGVESDTSQVRLVSDAGHEAAHRGLMLKGPRWWDAHEQYPLAEWVTVGVQVNLWELEAVRDVQGRDPSDIPIGLSIPLIGRGGVTWLRNQGVRMASDRSIWGEIFGSLNVLPPGTLEYARGAVIGGIARGIGQQLADQTPQFDPRERAIRLMAYYGIHAQGDTIGDLRRAVDGFLALPENQVGLEEIWTDLKPASGVLRAVVIGASVAKQFPELEGLTGLEEKRFFVDRGPETVVQLIAAGLEEAHYYGGLEESKAFSATAAEGLIAVHRHALTQGDFLIQLQAILSTAGIPDDLLGVGLEEFANELRQLAPAA